MKQSSPLSDWLGVTASVACAIHCAAMPFVVAFLPMLGLSFLADETFHRVMVFVCLALAAVAFIPGWKRHRRLVPAGIATAGLCLIATAAFALEGECCSACEAHSTSGLANGADVVAASFDAEASEEACCEHCESTGTAATKLAATGETTEKQLAGIGLPFLPWVTPLGGLLLVTAHLTNRRFSCGCCPTTSKR